MSPVQTIASLAIVSASFHFAAQAVLLNENDVVIDQFIPAANATALIFDGGGSFSDAESQTGLNPAFTIGGRRDVSVEHLGGTDFQFSSAHSTVKGGAGVLTLWNYGGGVNEGIASMTWGGGGALNADFSGVGEFVVIMDDAEIFTSGAYGGSVPLGLTLTSSSGSATVFKNVPHTFDEQQIRWSLGEFGGVDFADVDSLTLFLTESLPANSFHELTFTQFYGEAATPVPEPEEWAALTGGLLLAGAALRRRCQRN